MIEATYQEMCHLSRKNGYTQIHFFEGNDGTPRTRTLQKDEIIIDMERVPDGKYIPIFAKNAEGRVYDEVEINRLHENPALQSFSDFLTFLEEPHILPTPI